jgi:hypothetical protein
MTFLCLIVHAQAQSTSPTATEPPGSGAVGNGSTPDVPVKKLSLPDGGLLVMTHENDWFFGTDRDFTSSLRMAYTSPNYREWNDVPLVPDFMGAMVDKLSFIHDDWATVGEAMYMQQNMYTPNNETITPPNADDRPYAGWLGLGMDLFRQNLNRRTIIEINPGIVGPASGAEALQEGYHALIDSTDPKGWGSQIRNEPVLQFTYRQDWRPDALTNLNITQSQTIGYDVIGHGLITAGNGWDYAAVGVQARLGYHLPFDFGPSRPRLGDIDTLPYQPGGSVREPTNWSAAGASVYGVVGAEGRAVARDITLDGNTFEHSASVNKDPLVAEYYLGIVVQWGALHSSFLANYETATFKSQVQPGQWRGIVTVGWSF